MISDDVLNEVYEKPKNGCCHNSWADIRSSLFHLHNMKTISGTPAWLEHLKMLLLMWKTSLTDAFLLEEHQQRNWQFAIFLALLLSLKTHALMDKYTPKSNLKQEQWVTYLCQHLHSHKRQCKNDRNKHTWPRFHMSIYYTSNRVNDRPTLSDASNMVVVRCKAARATSGGQHWKPS